MPSWSAPSGQPVKTQVIPTGEEGVGAGSTRWASPQFTMPTFGEWNAVLNGELRRKYRDGSAELQLYSLDDNASLGAIGASGTRTWNEKTLENIGFSAGETVKLRMSNGTSGGFNIRAAGLVLNRL